MNREIIDNSPNILLFTEQQWLLNSELQMFDVTKEDIKNVQADGFMKYLHGVKLYLQRFIT